MRITDGHVPLARGDSDWFPIGPHRARYVFRELGQPYALVEWIAPAAVPGPPQHYHRGTEEVFYVLEGTFAFQVGDETRGVLPGTCVVIRRGQMHTFWNTSALPGRLLIVISPPDFASYFAALSTALSAGDGSPEEALRVRRLLSAHHDIEVLEPAWQVEG